MNDVEYKSIVVRRGECLSSIAARELGSPRRAVELYLDNMPYIRDDPRNRACLQIRWHAASLDLLRSGFAGAEAAMLTPEHLARGDNLRTVRPELRPIVPVLIDYVRGPEYQFPTYEQYVEQLWRDRQARIAARRNQS